MYPTNYTTKNKSGKIPGWLSFIRVVLGFILFWKGVLFIYDSSSLTSLLQGTGLNMPNNTIKAIGYIIPYINILGGLFIATGLFTRWAALTEIPILIGAIFFISAGTGVGMNHYELMLSIMVLLGLVVFVIKGSGFISADEFFNSYYKAGTENGKTKNFFS